MSIVLACAGGAFGAIAGTLWGFSLQGSSLESNVDAAGTGALCAGIGWFAGATLGLARSRHGNSPVLPWVWILRAGSIAFVVAGILVARWVPSLDTHAPAAELGPLQRTIMIDAILASVTLLVLARPSVVVRRSLSSAAAATAVALVVLAGVAARAIPEARDVHWADAWWARQDAGEIPAGLLGSAPRTCPNDAPASTGLDRQAFAYNMAGHLPHELSEGFGLLEWSAAAGDEQLRARGVWPGPPDTIADSLASGLWTDGGCRAILLALFSVPRSSTRGHDVSPRGPTVGGWTLVHDASCGDAIPGPGGCLEYRSEPFQQDGVRVLVMHLRGIDRTEADAIALGISTSHVDGYHL